MTSGGLQPDLHTELLELARATAEEAALLVGGGAATGPDEQRGLLRRGPRQLEQLGVQVGLGGAGGHHEG